MLQLREDDEPWYASARWVLGREDSISFVADSLISHLAPLYVPYAPITATDAAEVRTTHGPRSIHVPIHAQL
jgi:hypothetical protein